MKEWEVTINHLFGCDYPIIRVKANTERKAGIRAMEKWRKNGKSGKCDYVVSASEVEIE